jgi:hypothetical protein
MVIKLDLTLRIEPGATDWRSRPACGHG